MTLDQIGAETLTAKKHARKSWQGMAHIEHWDSLGLFIIRPSKSFSAPYAVSFDDLMANDWETVQSGQDSHIKRTMQLGPREMKMMICDLIDAQDALGHTFTMRIEGDKLTVTSTTREYGEPTERDREVARYVDTSYNEIRSAYK